MVCFDTLLKRASRPHAFSTSRDPISARCQMPTSTHCAIFVLAIVLSVGQATASSSEDASLRAQVSKYWNAIMSFDLATAYHMEEGAHSGALSPLAFRKQWSETDWELVDFRLHSTKLMDQSGKVTIELTFDVPQLSKHLSRMITDHWTIRGDEWLHVSRLATNDPGALENAP